MYVQDGLPYLARQPRETQSLHLSDIHFRRTLPRCISRTEQIVEKLELLVVAPATEFFALRAPVGGMET